MSPLPEHGLTREEIVDALTAKRVADARWQDGRTFGMVFDGGPGVHAVAEAVARMFLHDNALNTAAFPSLGAIQAEVVEATAALLHAPEGAAGFMTSGGTESILGAVMAARERGRSERGITTPSMVLPESAHAAFHKAAHYFGIETRKAAVGPDFRADVGATAAAIDRTTVLVVGSAPQYPQGVIDPITDLAALAAEAGANFHTDACMGGFVLPFMELLGHDVPPWDFRVEGVTSISADIHKLGYAPKGASVVLYRDRALRRHQTFVFDDWLGGRYASSGVQGSRSALPLATAWAVMHHLGIDGYKQLTATTIETSRRMAAAIRATDALTLVGEPDAHLLAFAAAPGWGDRFDVFELGDALRARGWFHDRQTPPDSLHATVSAGNAAVIDEWIADLSTCTEAVTGARASDRSTTYSTLE